MGPLHSQVLEELVPKAGPGREARLEKKKMMAQKRRDREISPGTLNCMYIVHRSYVGNKNLFLAEMAESTLMGPT
jgi:hypothetical protein